MQVKSYAAFRPEWVEQARAGDREAIAALYRCSYQDVCLTVHALLKSDANTIRVLVRSSFQRAFSTLNELGDAAKFPVWARILARNTALDWLRTNCPAAFSVPNTPEIPFDPGPLQAGGLPELPLGQAEAVQLTQELLAPLDEGERLMMGLYYHEQLGVPQIARMTGCREGTVRTRLYTGQRRLETRAVELAQAGADLYRMAPLPLVFALRQRLERGGLTPDESVLREILSSQEYGQTEVLSEEALAAPFKAVYQQPEPVPPEDFTPPTEAQQECGQTEVLSEEELNPPADAPQVHRQPTQDFSDTDELVRKAPASSPGKPDKAAKPDKKAKMSSGSRRLVIVLLIVLVCLLAILGVLLYSQLSAGSDNKTQEAAVSGSAAVLEETTDDEDAAAEDAGETAEDEQNDMEEQSAKSSAAAGTAEERAYAAYDAILEEHRTLLADRRENGENVDQENYPDVSEQAFIYSAHASDTADTAEAVFQYETLYLNDDEVPELLITSAAGDYLEILTVYSYNTEEDKVVDVFAEYGTYLGDRTTLDIWSDEEYGRTVLVMYSHGGAYNSITEFLTLDGWTLTTLETYTYGAREYPDAPYLKESTGERLTEEEYQSAYDLFMEYQWADGLQPLT